MSQLKKMIKYWSHYHSLSLTVPFMLLDTSVMLLNDCRTYSKILLFGVVNRKKCTGFDT